MIQLTQSNKDKADIAIDESALEHGKPMIPVGELNEHCTTIGMDSFADCLNNQHGGQTRKRRKKDTHSHDQETYESTSQADLQNRVTHWKRIILLITAVTIHNIPGMTNILFSLADSRQNLFFLFRGTCCWCVIRSNWIITKSYI